MNYPQTAPAQMYVYDISRVLLALVDHQHNPDGMTPTPEWIDAFIANTIHEFEIVSVVGSPGAQTQQQLKSYRQCDAAIKRMWDSLHFPASVSGSMVILHRINHTLWMVTYDHHGLTHLKI